jgi:hypothetical protein
MVKESAYVTFKLSAGREKKAALNLGACFE